MDLIANTVGELKALLADLPDDMVPFSIEPPFNGIKLVPQENGMLLLARTRAPEKDEDVYGRKRAAA